MGVICTLVVQINHVLGGITGQHGESDAYLEWISTDSEALKSQLKFFWGVGMIMTDNIIMARGLGYHLDPYNSPKWNVGGLSALYELKMAIIASKLVILGLFPKAATAAKFLFFLIWDLQRYSKFSFCHSYHFDISFITWYWNISE